MHIFLTAPSVGTCPKCGKAIPGHRACAFCGFYKGREVINVLQKLDRKERKKKEKEMSDIEKEGAPQKNSGGGGARDARLAKGGKNEGGKDFSKNV